MKELLHEALQYDILTEAELRQLEERILMKKKEELISRHPYSMWQGRNGCWYTKIPTADGQKKLVKRKNEAEIRDLVYQYQRERCEDPTVLQIFEDWLSEKLAFGEIQKQTETRYRSSFARFFVGNPISSMRIKSLTEDELYDFVKNSIAVNQLSAKGYAEIRTILNGILKYAKRKRLTSISATAFFNDLDIGKNAFRKRTRNPSSEVFTDKEAKLIKDYIKENPTIRNLAILLCFQTGLRIGECAALKASDFNPQKKLLHCQRTEITYKNEKGKTVVTVAETPKTENADRYIIVLDECFETYRKVLSMNPFGEFLFMEKGKRIRGNALRRSLYRICDHVGIPRRSPHKIRKTYATTLIDARTAESLIQQQLGHKDISTTRNFYYVNNQNDEARRKQIETALSS